MAVVFAKESGDWSTTNTSIWGIWNDQTQQVEDYGQNPTADDDVFCNGYILTLKMSPTVKTLSNRKKYDYLNNDGGRIAYNAGYTLRADEIDFVQYSQTTSCFYFNVNSASVNCYIICPTIKIEGGVCFVHTYGNNAGWTITGNIYLKNTALADAGSSSFNHLLTINGNVIGEGLNYFVRTFATAPNGGWTIVVNGNCKLVGNDNVNNLGRLRLTVTGCYRNLDNNRFTFAQASTSSVALGAIEYYSTNNTFGMASFSQFSMVNPSGFYWHDITEPRSNPYFIVSNYDLQNTQQYPPENEVKEGTEYAWGELVGQYLPDYPPEAVVLKDYVYDNGERTGTLENEVTVNVGCTNPQDVRKDIPLANMGIVGTMVIPSPENVLEGIIYDNGTEGTLESQSTADYPAEDKVLIGTSYDHNNMTGTLEPGGDNPQESDVRFGVPYNHNLNTGKAHIPSSQDVRKNVPVEDTVGQIVIPRASEVKKDVEFDIDSVGTMESVIETNNTINVYRKK